MAEQKLKKIKVVSCEKNEKAEDIAKGILYKTTVQYIETVRAKSKIELKAGTEIDVVCEDGEFKADDGQKVKWLRVIEIINRK